MKNNLTYSLILLVSIALFSCSKKGKVDTSTKTFYTNSTLDPITDFYQTIRQTVNGEITLTSYNSIAMQNASCDSKQFHGGYKRGTGQRVCFGPKTVTLLGTPVVIYQEMPCDQCYDPNQTLPTFGQVVKFKADMTTLGNAYEHDIYVPTEVKFATPVYSAGQTISPNSTISWNTDATNPKGDAVYITYDPGSFENHALATSYPTPLAKGIPLNHEGAYTFTSGDFANFPDGAHLKIHICRYNFEVFTNEDTNLDYLAVVGSSVFGSFILEK